MMHSDNIRIIKNGHHEPVLITKMFVTHGPFLLEDSRLDLLKKVTVLVDSSTITSKQTGTSDSITSAKTGSLVGRAVVGGVLLGGTAAAVGALTGKKSTDTNINTTTTESKNIALTVELTFSNDTIKHVFLSDIDSYHWLISFTSQAPMSETEIESEKDLAKQLVHEKEEEQKQDFIRTELKNISEKGSVYIKYAREQRIKKLYITIYTVYCGLFPLIGFLLGYLMFSVLTAIPLLIATIFYVDRKITAYEDPTNIKFKELCNDKKLIEELGNKFEVQKMNC